MEALLKPMEISLKQVILILGDLIVSHVDKEHNLKVIEWCTMGRLIATGCVNGDHAWLDYQPDGKREPTRFEGEEVMQFLVLAINTH